MDRLPKLRRRPEIVTPSVSITSIASPHTATAPDHIASFTPISPTSSPLALPPAGPNGPSSGIPTLKSAASDSALGAAVTARRTRHSTASSVANGNPSNSQSPARVSGARDSTGSLIPTPAHLTACDRVSSAPPAVSDAQAQKSIGSLSLASSSKSSLILFNAAATGTQNPLPVSVAESSTLPAEPTLTAPPTLDTTADAAVATTPTTDVTTISPSASTAAAAATVTAAPSITTTSASPTAAKASRSSRLPSAFRSLPFRGPMKRSRSPAPPPISTSGAHFANPSITAIAVAATPSPSAAAPALIALGHNLDSASPASTITSPRGKGAGVHHRKVSSKGKFAVAGTALKNHFAAAHASWGSSPKMSPLLGKSRNSISGSGMRTPSPKGAKMPPFISSSIRDVQAKFNELTWIERNRVAFGCKRARKGRSSSPPRPSTSATCAPSGLEQLTRKPSYRHPEPAQQGLDRYINIQPWNHNRVTLDVPPDTQNYVNASPISLMSNGDPGGLPELRYIAMQGPTPVSTPYVWRMISERLDGEGVIVQLTNLVENHQNKCHAYFPLDKREGDMEINQEDIWNDGWRASLKFDTMEMLAGGAIEVRKLILTVREPLNLSKQAVPEDETESQTKTSNSAKASNPKASLLSVTEEEGTEEEELKAETEAIPQPETFTPDTVAIEATIEPAAAVIESIEPRDSATDATDTTTELITSTEWSSAESTPGPVVTRQWKIYHLFYTRWPDFGVPSAEDIPSFLNLMDLSCQYNHNASNPRIIHCSAGVGRTGTFIALEHLKRELDNGFLLGDGPGAAAMAAVNSGGQDDMSPVTPGCVDTRGDLIFNTVDALREQRKLMVQSEAQYVFLYQVLRRLWHERYGLSEEDVVEQRAKKQQCEEGK